MIIAMLPVRSGSKRLAKKNYLDLNGRTILERAIHKSLAAKCFDSVVVNTDDSSLKGVVEGLGAEFYLRASRLASDDATSDQVVLDFLANKGSASVYWVNTVSPFSSIQDIQSVVSALEGSEASSVVSVNHKFVHTLVNSTPSNFAYSDSGFAKTQDLLPVTLYNYAIMGWKRSAMRDLESRKLFTEDTLLVESSEQSSWLLKTREDFERLEIIARGFDIEV